MSSQDLGKRLFSGIQPTGNVHLGNYLGAMQQWVALQESHDALYCVVDLHAITVPQEPETLRRNILDMAKWYMAAGIDTTKSVIFVQSDVAAHSELAWLLNTVARMGDLEKMTQFKDKSEKEGAERSTVGLFDYPVLMAADILLYDTQVVPVGEDQTQHIELARNLAERFNGRFGETFVVPEGKVSTEGARIRGLDDPTKKMSKSAASEYNYIALTDDAATIEKKIKRAVTDSEQGITYSDERPALKNLLNIYHLVTGRSVEDIVAHYDGKGFGDFKAGLAEAVVAHLAPLQERFAQISDDEVRAVLAAGAARARQIADAKIAEVKGKMGLGA